MPKKAKKNKQAPTHLSFVDAYIKPKWESYLKALCPPRKDNSFEPIRFKTKKLFWRSLKNRPRYPFPYWLRLKALTPCLAGERKTQLQIVQYLGMKKIKHLCRQYAREDPYNCYYPAFEPCAFRDEMLQCMKLVFCKHKPGWLRKEFDFIEDEEKKLRFVNAWLEFPHFRGPDALRRQGPYYDRLYRGREHGIIIGTQNYAVFEFFPDGHPVRHWTIQLRSSSSSTFGNTAMSFQSIGLSFHRNWIAFATFYSYASRREKLYLPDDVWRKVSEFVTVQDLFVQVERKKE